jgi:hypothetical protein
MVVDGCWVLVSRVRAIKSVANVRFTIEWVSGYSWAEGGPETGENLDAQTWSDGKVKASVGTEDGDRLAQRAGCDDWMPDRLQEELSVTQRDGPVRHTETSLTVTLPSLHAGECCQVHFVVAWGADTVDDCSTWYAVEVPSQNLSALFDARRPPRHERIECRNTDSGRVNLGSRSIARWHGRGSA